MGMVQVVPDDELLEVRPRAIERISRRDPDDWPAVAAALVLDCPIWTEDADFFGSGVATWTTDTVEIYLSGTH
jgi:predicted nucleic acid-binding protein